MKNLVNVKEKRCVQNDKDEFILSTSWNAFRSKDAQTLLDEIKNIGFSRVELSFNLTLNIVKEIKKYAKNKYIKILSLHNFCPIPEELPLNKATPDCFSLSSLDEEERKRAIESTKNTIDTAVELEAKVVVLHIGRVEIPERTKDLIFLYKHSFKESPFFRIIRDKAIRERAMYAKKYFQNCIKSLEVLNDYASKRDILLGIENRFYYREIPTFEELGVLFSIFKNSNIFYWHDVGHAQVMQNLGFFTHKDFLDAYSYKMLGIHLHDVTGCSDHRAPGVGELDFSIFKPYLRRETLKVIETHHPTTSEQLIKAKDYLRKTLLTDE